MSLFFPHERYHRITDIPPEHFEKIGVGALILDIDNTLTTHDNPAPAQGVLDWLDSVKALGVRCIILSNNTSERVTPFAEMLSLDFEAKGRKPLTGGVFRACEKMNAKKENTALIGDQIFTDVLAARLSGVRCILVDPIEAEKTCFFKLKRWLERPIIRAFERRYGK